MSTATASELVAPDARPPAGGISPSEGGSVGTPRGKKISRETAKFARDIPAKSWFAIISSITLLGLTVAGTFPFWAMPFRVISSVLAALMIVRVFVIYHDHQHRAILPKSKLAEWLMKVVGVLLLTPSSVWKHSHDSHHAHNSKLHGNDLGSFPTMTVERYRASSFGTRCRYRISRHPLTILFGYITAFIVSMCIEPFFDHPKKHIDGFLALVIHGVLIATVAVVFGWLAVLLAICLPFLIGACLGSYLFYAQHNFPRVVLKDEDGWTYEGAALESSSFMKMPKILHWFTGNIGFHHIHHLNARIPFYRLPEVYEAIPELQQAKTTSLSPVDIYRCFQLKIWDVKEQRLVSYRG